MKKILLTVAVGMLILSLPVIASAASGFDSYSGYTAQVAIHGFTLYSTSAGKTAGMKALTKTYKAAGTLAAVGNNTYGYFDTLIPQYAIDVPLNANTTMEIRTSNPIALKNGKVVLSNASYWIFNDTGATPTDYWGGMSAPASAGLTATQYVVSGGCTVKAAINPTTHTMVLALSNISSNNTYTGTIYSETDTNGKYGTAGNIVWDKKGYYRNPVYDLSYVVTGVSIAPIKLAPTSDVGYGSAWWQ